MSLFQCMLNVITHKIITSKNKLYFILYKKIYRTHRNTLNINKKGRHMIVFNDFPILGLNLLFINY